jgi:mannosyltransferase
MLIHRFRVTWMNFQERPIFHFGLLTGITLLAAVLRFYKLGQWSFWIDEIFTIDRALTHYGNIESLFRNIPPYTNWVPTSVIMTAEVLNRLGVSEWTSRLTSALIGTLSIPVLYFPLKNIFNRQVTLIALLLLAISPWHIEWSQNARFYTSLLLFSSLALFAFYNFIEKGHLVYLIIFYFLLYLATSERLSALFVLPVVICYVLSLMILPLEKPKGLSRKTVFLSFAPLFGLAVFDLSQYVLNGSSILSNMDIFVGQINTSPFRLTLSIIYRTGIPVFVLGIFAGIYTIIKKERAILFVFISALFPILMLLFLSLFMFAVDRYIFQTLFFWLILGALAIDELLSHAAGFAKLIPLGVLMVVLVSGIGEVFLYNQYQNGNRPKWREAYQLVEQKIQDGDIVFSTRPEIGDYYLPDADNRNVLSFDPSLILDSKSADLYFIIDENTGFAESEIYPWVQDNCLLIRNLEVFLPGKSLGIDVYHYPPTIDP